MTHKKTKILYVMQDPPPYDYYTEAPRPSINWDTPDGSWVGIWGYEWADILGSQIRNHFPEYEFEVWQPDPRAKMIYTHQFKTGLRHTLFPAERRKKFGNIIITSPSILEQLRQEKEEFNLILQTDLRTYSGWLIMPNKHLTTMGVLHGAIHLPIHEFFKVRKNLLRYYFLLREQKLLKTVINHFDLITYQNQTNLEDLQAIYGGPLRKITMGVDFEKFYPLDKCDCRDNLGLPQNKRIFITVGRINSLKQSAELIKVFNQLSKDFDFLLVVIGTASDSKYMKHLLKTASPLLAEEKVLFTGYKNGRELIEYYNAADLFLMTSLSEGGPVVSMEAIACETPVFTTQTGYIAELLTEYQTGYVAGVRDYKEWKDVLTKFMSGRLEITIFDRTQAEKEFSWPAIARKFDAAYRVIDATRRHPYGDNKSTSSSPSIFES